MDPLIIEATKLGLYGGIARAVFALLKALLGQKTVKWSAWAILLAMTAASGAFLGAVLNFSSTISLLAGYAGFDLLDSVHKLLKIGTVKIPVKTIGIKSVQKKSTFEEAMEMK